MINLIKHNNDILTSYDKIFSTFFNTNNNNNKDVELGKTNIIEKDTGYEIDIVTPGIEKDNIDISISEDVIEIAANQEYENNNETDKIIRREFGRTSFKRVFQLPDDIKKEKIDAKMNNGILKINIPKKKSKPENKKLEIQIK